MQSNSDINHFNFNYKNIVVDEIALEGLDGIGFELLWGRMAHRLGTEITHKMKIKFWNFIIDCQSIELYDLPQPAVVFKIEDRFKFIHEESGNLKAVDFHFDGPFELNLIPGELGSSSNYYKRQQIPKNKIWDMTFEEVIEKYGETLIFVASREERWHALAPQEPYKIIDHLVLTTPNALAMLELIGRGRENGQLTVGYTNLTKISNDPKMIFYYKNRLEEWGLINSVTVVQFLEKRNVKSLFFRLQRFYKPKLITGPKEGIMFGLTDHLLSLPDHRDSKLNLIQSKIINQPVWKRLLKKLNTFKFETESDKKGGIPKRTHVILCTDTEDSDHSDEEPILPCKQKVGVNMYTQAYDVLLEAGLKGYTQIELGDVLGVNFYTSRSICRTLKNLKLVRMLTVNQGKQKTRKFIANGASSDSIQVYVDEKQKLLNYLSEKNIGQNFANETTKRKASESENNEIPLKKIKLEQIEKTVIDDAEISDNIIEYSIKKNTINLSIKKSLSLPTSGLTLRQLKIANAIIKIIRQHKIVETLKILNSLICKEVGPPPLDAKCLKRFLLKLAADGQLRVYNFKWPGFDQRNTLIICLPNMDKNHPSLLAVYAKISAYAQKKKILINEKKLRNEHRNKLFTYTYPRYLKIKKMHEFLYNLIYLNPDGVDLFNSDTSLPQGFASIGHVIPEMPLELVVGHLSVKKLYDLSYINYEEAGPDVKLKDAPNEIRQCILYCKSFTVSLKASIDMLASFGLLQTCFRTESILSSIEDRKKQLFFLNRNAKVVDTRGKWPRDIPTGTNKFFTFSFDSVNIVNKYWSIVQDICLRTKVNSFNRKAEPIEIPVRTVDEIMKADNGQILGDGVGPGGFSSGFRTDMSQLWRPFSILNCKRVPIVIKPNTHQLKKPSRVSNANSKKEQRKQKTIIRKLLEPSDASQKSAKTIEWTNMEDEILLWTKVAMTIMSHSGIANYLHITNLVAKDLLALQGNNRTVLQCIRRGKVLDTKPKFIHQKQLLITEIRHNEPVLQKYEGLLKNIRAKYLYDLQAYIQESRIRLMELVWIVVQLSRVIKDRNMVPAIAMNFSDFHEKYKIVMTKTNKSLFRTPDECPIEIGTIKEGIMLVLCLGHVTTFTASTSTVIFETFNKYEERHLRTATKQLHKSCAVAVKDKSLNNQLQKTTFNDMLQYAAGYKLSSFYQRRWANRMNTSFVDNLTNILESYEPTDHIKGSPEICCFLLELNANKALKLITTQEPIIPDIIADEVPQMDIEIRNNFKSGRLGWSRIRNVTFMKELYKSIDYCSAVMFLIRSATVKNVGKNISLAGYDVLLNSLEQAGSKGKTFQQLQNLTGYTTELLIENLEKLEEEHVVKRVGYYENLIVLSKYLQPWCIQFSTSTNIIPSPWYLLGLQITYPIFINWCSTILNKVFEAPGSSVFTIAEALDFITPRSTQDVCMFLEKCQCVILKTLKIKKVDIFSDDDDGVQLSDFNEYAAMDSIVVFPVTDCIIKYANLKENIKQYCIDVEKG